MSIKSKSQIANDITTYFPDNTTEEISALDERNQFNDINDSALNIVDGGTVVQSLAGYSTNLTPTDDKHFAPKKYVDDSLIGDKYLFGNETTDGSIRIRYDSGDDATYLEKRISGTWSTLSTLG